MLFIFIIGLITGIYLAQEYSSIPKVKPIVMSFVEKIKNKGTDNSTSSHSSTNVDDDKSTSEKKE